MKNVDVNTSRVEKNQNAPLREIVLGRTNSCFKPAHFPFIRIFVVFRRIIIVIIMVLAAAVVVVLWGGFVLNNSNNDPCSSRRHLGVGWPNPSSNKRFLATATALLLASEKKATSSLIIRDVIDEEAAMTSFFSTREEWSATFRLLAGESLPKDTRALLTATVGTSSSLWPDEDHHGNDENKEPPWQQYQGVPQDDKDRAVLETFLNSMHQALLDIPVTDSYVGQGEPLENDNDRQFLEEGRRMLAVNRYHVLSDNAGSSLQSTDALFTYCWSELRQLVHAGQTHTGSIILLPRYARRDLERFTEMNVARPLSWLGLESVFEVCANLQFGAPAIRMLYKLDDMPVVSDDDNSERQ
jgi:hypothetical protein